MTPHLLRDALALTFASFFPLAMALVYFVALDQPDDRSNPAFLTAFAAGKCVQFLFPMLYVVCFDRQEIRIARPTSRGLLMGVGFGLLVGLLMFVLYFAWIRHITIVVEKTPAMIYHRLQQFGQATPQGYLQLALYISCVHSLAEEFYWRWFVFGWLRRHVTIGWAIVLSSAGFMLHHIVILGAFFPDSFWSLAMPFSLCVAVGGGVWAWIYDRSQSLYAAWISHALIDAAILALGYIMLKSYW